MCLLYLTGTLLSRRADSLNSLGLAVWVLCLASPYAGADVGLLLSYSATLGLILCSNPLTAWLDARVSSFQYGKRLFHAVHLVLATSVSATLFTLPVIALTFRSVSAVGLLANLLALWPTTLLLQLGLGAAFLQLLLPGTLAAMPLAIPAGWLAKLVKAIVHLLAQVPYASLPVSMGFVLLWIAAVLILLAVCVWMGPSKPLLRTAAWLSCILLLAGIFSYQVSQRDITRIAVADVGSGLSVAVTRNGHALVVGCEGYSTQSLENELQGRGVQSLDGMLLFTHFGEEAHNAAEVLEDYPADRLVLPSGYMDDFLQAEAAEIGETHPYREAAKLTLGSAISVEMINGAALLNANGVTVLFCPAGVQAENLPEAWRSPHFAVLAQDVEGIEAEYTVLSMDESDVGDAVAGRQQVTATAGLGTVAIEITDGQTCRIRRDA